jgi:diguanylate cyclase (GGDEF)-like protein
LFNIIVRSQCVRSGEALLAANQKLGALAEMDGLTGIANRRVFDERLRLELASAQRSGQPLSLLMIDVDHFKALNDSSGHLAGDSYLVQVAQALHGALPRSTDLAARYGGEEFAVLLSSTPTPGALKIAETLHNAVARLALEHPASPSGRLTISIGLATADNGTHPSSTALVDAADRALYSAKSLGRNQTAYETITQAPA